jgi:hypothetical protein
MEAPSFEGPLAVIWNDNKVFGEPSVTRARMCENTGCISHYAI